MFATKEVRGESFEGEEKTKYFTSNTSLIHLQMTEKLSVCGRHVYKTDFKDVYLLDLNKERPISNQLPSAELSIFKAFGVQDNFIYNRMTHILKDNIQRLARHHCLDNQLSTQQWNKLMTKSRANKLQPFALNPDENRFFCLWVRAFTHFLV